MRRGRVATPAIDRLFLRLVPVGECLEYDGARCSFGYGSIKIVVGAGIYRAEQAHRIVWETHYGSIPDGLLIRHTCDNPPCCNPEHLLLGTQKDNMHDMAERGRRADQRRERCYQDHLLDPENTYEYTDKHGIKHRRCRTCQRIRNRTYTMVL